MKATVLPDWTGGPRRGADRAEVGSRTQRHWQPGPAAKVQMCRAHRKPTVGVVALGVGDRRHLPGYDGP